MGGKAFGFFTLVEKLVTALIGQLPGYEKAPKPWVARELIRLFDVLGQARESFTGAAHWVSKCEKAETREGRAYFLFEAGKILDRSGDICAKLLPWKGDTSQVFEALKLLAPEIKDTLEEIETDEVTFREVVVAERLDLLRRVFQAVPQPDPARLPNSEMLQELRDRLERSSARCAEAMETLRDFAAAGLEVRDFFQPSPPDRPGTPGRLRRP